jgi:hypothetical protein
MPKPKLWSFILEDDFLLLKCDDKIEHGFGPVVEARCIKDKPTHIKVWLSSIQLHTPSKP